MVKIVRGGTRVVMVCLDKVVFAVLVANHALATIQHLPLTNADTAVSGLCKRYFSLVKMGDKLPADDIIQSPELFDLDGLVTALPQEWFKESNPLAVPTDASEPASGNNHEATEVASQPSPEAAPPVNRAALTLAFFGWDTAPESAAGLVGCAACFRRLGLWMYKPKANGEVTVYSSLDVAFEHMEYCPWIDRAAQSGTGRPHEKMEELRSGWELVAQAVKVKHRRRIRSAASMDTVRTDSTTLSAESVEGESEETKKTSDREWWSKIRRMRQVLTTKSPRRKSILPQ